jgi:hypothetical protein
MLGYHDHVPTILVQEWLDDVSCALAAERFFGRGAARGSSAPPDIDLSCLPIVPPVDPAWASAEDAFAETKCDRASKAIPIDARHLILPPRLRGGIVLVK